MSLSDLRALVHSDDDLASTSVEVLTVLKYSDRAAETLTFDLVDVTVDRQTRLITFEGILSVDDETVRLDAERFIELTATIAKPLDGDMLADWEGRRHRPAWPMPSSSQPLDR